MPARATRSERYYVLSLGHIRSRWSVRLNGERPVECCQSSAVRELCECCYRDYGHPTVRLVGTYGVDGSLSRDLEWKRDESCESTAERHRCRSPCGREH